MTDILLCFNHIFVCGPSTGGFQRRGVLHVCLMLCRLASLSAFNVFSDLMTLWSFLPVSSSRAFTVAVGFFRRQEQMSDFAYMNGSGLGMETELSEVTGVLDQTTVPVWEFKDRRTNTSGASFRAIKVKERCCCQFLAGLLQRGWPCEHSERAIVSTVSNC